LFGIETILIAQPTQLAYFYLKNSLELTVVIIVIRENWY